MSIIIPETEMSTEAFSWLFYDLGKGKSSVAMFTNIVLGMDLHSDYPKDYYDFERCLHLVRQVPEVAERYREMAKVSTYWGKIVDEWDNICELIKQKKLAEADDLIRLIISRPL